MNINLLKKFKSMKNRDKFLLLLFFNTLFFSFLAYILPLRFEENDDVIMCLISSGTYSGVPDAHLVYINYLYGWFVTMFYNILPGIEWYTIFFCIIHIISLTIISYVIVKRTDKSTWLKTIILVFLYVIEIRIMRFFQFTTTAAICSFAGLLLLMFEDKKLPKVFGTILFIIGTLIRYKAATLVVLLMLPILAYKIFLNRKIFIKSLISVFICFFIIFASQIIETHIYGKDKEWDQYKQYDKMRGQINDNPNSKIMLENLPDDVSKNDFILLLAFFPDGKLFDLSKIKELDKIRQSLPFAEKIKNFYPSLRTHTLILSLFLMLFFVSFLAQKRKMDKAYALFYILYFIGMLLYVSLDASLKYRIFMSALFVVTFFLYETLPNNSNKLIKIGLIGVIIMFSLFLTYGIYRIRVNKREFEKTRLVEQWRVIDEVKNKNVTVVPLAADFSIELCDPFKISKSFSDFAFKGAGWLTTIPLNEGIFDSYMSLVENNIYLFATIKNADWYIKCIQQSLKENYNCETEVFEKFRSTNYLLIQIRKK